MIVTGLCLPVCNPAISQDTGDGIDKASGYSSSFFNKVHQKTIEPDARLIKQTGQYRQQLVKSEEKLNRGVNHFTKRLCI